jgi:protein-tyrosine-phosphatase
MHPPIELLFLCTGNSCRSIMAEACCNARAGGRLHARSAGSQPTGFVHPWALRQLTRAGIAVEGLQSKSWAHLPSRPQIIITLCDSAAGESCPAYLGTGSPRPLGAARSGPGHWQRGRRRCRL